MNKKKSGLAVCLSVLLLSPILLSPLHGWEAGLDFTLSSLNFHPDRAPTDRTFSAYYFPIQYSIFLSHQFDENTAFDLTFSRDNILRNVLYGNFSYGMDYFTLEVGPFFGVGNTAEMPLKAGLLASIEIRSPGKVFLLIRSGRTLNLLNIFTGDALSGTVSSIGDFMQEMNEVGFGLYLRNTILSLYVHSKIYTHFTGMHGVVSDSQTDYGVRTHIFQKNIPVRIVLSFFYRNLSRFFEDLPNPSEHTIGSIIFGSRFEYTISPHWVIYAELESSIYSFGLNDLIGEFASTEYLFSLRTGFRYLFR